MKTLLAAANSMHKLCVAGEAMNGTNRQGQRIKTDGDFPCHSDLFARWQHWSRIGNISKSCRQPAKRHKVNDSKRFRAHFDASALGKPAESVRKAWYNVNIAPFPQQKEHSHAARRQLGPARQKAVVL